MKEILGGDLERAFVDLNIIAKKTYEGSTLLDDKTQVWELSDEDHIILCNMSEGDWKDEWGWWRSAVGSNMCNPISRFNVNHHYIQAWDGQGRLDLLEENKSVKPDERYWEERKYDNLLQYLGSEIGASQPRNVCALVVDLAAINNMTIGELFNKYQA